MFSFSKKIVSARVSCVKVEATGPVVVASVHDSFVFGFGKLS